MATKTKKEHGKKASMEQEKARLYICMRAEIMAGLILETNIGDREALYQAVEIFLEMKDQPFQAQHFGVLVDREKSSPIRKQP